jgi:molybdopterin-dependent oxidoreductase alpha subunit
VSTFLPPLKKFFTRELEMPHAVDQRSRESPRPRGGAGRAARVARAVIAAPKQMHPAHQLLRVVWENRRALPFAWKILTRGICDGCSLGSRGLRDDSVRSFHLCRSGLKRLRFHTMEALNVSALENVDSLKRLDGERLGLLGRLPFPLLLKKGARRFLRVGWQNAIQIACASIHDTAPHQMAFVAAGSGLSNEAYYVFQKLARVLGTNNVALYSSPANAGSLAALHATLGVGAASCSLADLIDTDLLVVFASDVARIEPQLLDYFGAAKKRGTRIVAVQQAPEHGLTRRPLTLTSSLAVQAKLMDEVFSTRTGGETAFVKGVLKALIAWNKVDHEFIASHTEGFESLTAALAAEPWQALEESSGCSRSDMQRFAARYRAVRSAVFVYCNEPARREAAACGMKAVVNLALARGMLGREKCGILPILSQSGVQGGVDCGVQPDKFPGGLAINDQTARRYSNLWYHPAPSNPGLSLRELMEAAHRGKLKFLYSMGADLLQALPDRRFTAEALARVPLRIHQDIMLSPSQLVDSTGTVLILPAQTRFEQRGGVTTTSTDRRILFSSEIPGHIVGESLPDWGIPAAIGRSSMPNGESLFPFSTVRNIREEMTRVIPIYEGIESLNRPGHHLQWGGPHLFKGGKFRGMPRERALFSVLESSFGGTAEETGVRESE